MLLARCRYAPAVDEPPDAAGVDSSASMFIQSAAQRRPVGGGAPPNIFLPSRPASVYFFSLSTTDLIADVYRLLPGFTQRNGPPWPHIPTPSISLYRVLLGFFFYRVDEPRSIWFPWAFSVMDFFYRRCSISRVVAVVYWCVLFSISYPFVVVFFCI